MIDRVIFHVFSSILNQGFVSIRYCESFGFYIESCGPIFLMCESALLSAHQLGQVSETAMCHIF